MTMPTSTPTLRAHTRTGIVVTLIALFFFLSAPLQSFAATPTKDDNHHAPVLFIGVNGLRWDAVTLLDSDTATRERFPRTWQLLDSGALGNMIVRSKNYRACPVDGWLGLSSATRIAWKNSPTLGDCPTMRAPKPLGDSSFSIPDYQAATASFKKTKAFGGLGLLASTFKKHHISATAVGNGAALALADSHGVVHFPFIDAPTSPQDLSRSVTSALTDSDVVIVDATTTHIPRQSALPEDVSKLCDRFKDSPDIALSYYHLQRIENILASIPQQTTVVVGSLADGYTGARAQLIAISQQTTASQTTANPPALLYSSTTRQPTLVLTTNLAMLIPELLKHPQSLDSSSLNVISVQPSLSPPATVHDDLADRARHAAAGRYARGPFSVTFTSFVVLIVALVPWTWSRRRRSAALAHTLGVTPADTATSSHHSAPFAESPTLSQPALKQLATLRQRTLHIWAIAGLWVAGIPTGAFISNLVPWWRPGPAWTEAATSDFVWYSLGATWLTSAIIVMVAMGVHYIVKSPLTPVIVLSAITTLALVIDPMIGSPMPFESAIATASVFGARFYGIGNTQFAILVTAALMLVTFIAIALIKSDKRALAATITALVFAVITIVDGIVYWGADFGGPPAIIIGGGILVLTMMRIRVRWPHILVLTVVAFGLSMSITYFDWLRPPMERTHLGNFFQSLLDGNAWTVMSRKLTSMILADGWQVWQVALLLILAAIVIVLAYRPVWMSHHTFEAFSWLHPQGKPWRMLDIDPLMRPLLVSWAVLMLVASLINDSLFLIPFIACGYLIPALVSFTAQWLLAQKPSDQ